MSELKADKTFVFGEECLAYKKSEADNVIAEKDKQIAGLRNEADIYKAKYEQEYDIAVHNEKQLSAMRIELRHHKYKRCLAMAEVLEHVCPMTNRKAKWRDKWHKRWLTLADKYKDGNV